MSKCYRFETKAACAIGSAQEGATSMLQDLEMFGVSAMMFALQLRQKPEEALLFILLLSMCARVPAGARFFICWQEQYNKDMTLKEAEILALTTLRQAERPRSMFVGIGGLRRRSFVQVMEEKLSKVNIEVGVVPTSTGKPGALQTSQRLTWPYLVLCGTGSAATMPRSWKM